MAKRDPANNSHMVIVGGGAAGLNAAETLRQSNFTGQITVISDDKRLPYDRTILSKNVSGANVDNLLLRSSEFLDTYDIDYRLGYNVSKIDRSGKKVLLADGGEVSYDKLLLATGSQARVPKSPGIELKNVHVLRSGAD